MAQHFLDAAQVRTALDQMGGGRVPKTMWSEVGKPGYGGQSLVHDPSRGTRVEPPATSSK